MTTPPFLPAPLRDSVFQTWQRKSGGFFILGALFAAIWLMVAPAADGQTLALDNDSQTFASLAGTTVTMTGRSELRITGATAPITGSIIHLNSPDSWLFMTNIRPSVVNSTYLGQIRVNGAAAVLNSNCRIVQYADGTVVIPHSPTYSPMQVFSGSHFTGTAFSLQNHTAYNDGSLGALANNISSFKLKRGYMATIAQNASGTGVSKNYVAQDGDIEVSVMPEELNDSVSFVRIFPWRWVGKKGSCDIAPETLDARWHYNWDNNRTSPLDWEYVPIKQQRWWPADPNGKIGSTHVLGYNEPNNPVEDSYESLNGGSVDAAIAAWPELQFSGLRLGSPAVTDGGEAWLYDFMAKADAAKLRVDFVAIHFYRCGYTAQGLYDWLYNIHVRTGRKLWVTEFNNGANWTTCADPTLAQNASTIAAFIEMMDNAPFIERYAVYSNVEEVRKMVAGSPGTLTPAGVNYQANPSPVAYSQEIPEVPTPPVAFYQFENNARDSSPYGHPAVLNGSANFAAGNPSGRALELSGSAAEGDHVQLSSRLGDSTDFTFGAWVYWAGGGAWQRIFDLGAGQNNFMFLTPAAGGGNLRFAIKDGGAEQQLNHTAPLPINTWTHVAVTISGNIGKLFVDGSLVNTKTDMTLNPVDLETSNNFLGKSQFPDPLFAGRLDQVQFLSYALTDSNVAAMMTNTPPQFTSATLTGSAATQNVAYSGTISGTATDADPGDSVTYSKAQGPDWLAVAADGSLSGTPGFDDSGTQSFIVYATDRAGGSAFAVLNIQLPPVFTGNGTWTADLSGTWSESVKWTGGLPANGAGNTANFGALNLTADRTVTLDASRTIGSLQFGDTSGTESWTLAAANGRDLTLAGAAPVIAVNQNSATITASIEGTAGFTKTGAGTLILRGDNPLAGTLNVDAGSTSENSGVVRLAHPNSASGLTGIQIRNNNNGLSTLELDGSSGGITPPAGAAVSLSGRLGTVPAIRNLVGTNTLGSTITLQSGGGNYVLQSDSGTLVLNGALTSNAPASGRSLTFQGTGDIQLNGILSNGTTTSGIGVIKQGPGTLRLGTTNTFSGDVTIHAGTLAAGTAQGSTPTASNLGVLQHTTNRNLTIHNGATLSLTGGNVLGTGGSTNTLANTTLVINTGGLFQSGLNANATGWWNKIGTVNLNGGTIRVGSGANTTNFQGLALIGTVTVGGSTASTLENHPASSSASNGIHLGQNATAGQIINFNVADATASAAPDLTISARLLNTSANLASSGLLKTGSGTLLLSGASTYTGTTTVSGGTLLVNGSTGTSAVTVANTATLGGSGTVGGTVTVQSGGTLSPGEGVGKLTVTGPVALQPGSTTRMEINKGAATRDVLAVSGTLTYGGTLVVTNVAGTLSEGDSFTLFEGAARTGNFSAVNLPPLDAGLAWNTSNLATGSISVYSPASTYSGWAGGYVFPVGKAGSNEDADGDGMANALEWLFGSNPLAADSSFLPQPSVRILSTAEFPAAAAGKTYLTMTARVRKTHTGMTLVPQASTTLEALDTPASAGAVESFRVRDLGLFEERTWIHTQAIEDSPGGRGFMRLKLVGE